RHEALGQGERWADPGCEVQGSGLQRGDSDEFICDRNADWNERRRCAANHKGTDRRGAWWIAVLEDSLQRARFGRDQGSPEEILKMIAVAMSGGVDSSATAALLKERGEEIVGLSMQLWRDNGRCCSLDDLWDARRVATQLGIPYYVLNLEKDFEKTVVAPFVDTYLRGETPSPCILCNNYVKFHHLVENAAGIRADRVAPGHYARVKFDEALGRWLLLRGKDRKKDQSYFLFGLNQDQLSKTVFPLGELTKPEVREIARRAGLPTSEKAESQEICFVEGR